MNHNIVLDSYMATGFVSFEKNEKKVSLAEIVQAFSVNTLYNSKTPIFRHGPEDYYFDDSNKLEYVSEISDNLLKYDRYSIQGRIAFFELMRISLPSYIIHIDDQKIVVESFLSVYKNKICGITHNYKDINTNLSVDHGSFLELSRKVKYIEFGRLLADILKLEVPDDVDDSYDSIMIGYEDFIEYFGANPFLIHIEFVIEILKRHNENMNNKDKNNENQNEYSYNFFNDIFRVYNIKNNMKTNNKQIEYIRKTTEELSESQIFNPNISFELEDISIEKNQKILLHHNYLLFIVEPSHNSEKNRLIPLYAHIEKILNIRIKIHEAYKLMKYDYQNLDTIEDYVNFKKQYLHILNIDVGYEFMVAEEAKANLVFNRVLRIDFLLNEINQVFERRYKSASIDYDIEHKKRIEFEKRRDKQYNYLFQLLALLFAIPAITEIVDIMYLLEVNNKIYFPIGIAKLISIILATISVLVIGEVIRRKQNY